MVRIKIKQGPCAVHFDQTCNIVDGKSLISGSELTWNNLTFRRIIGCGMIDAEY